MKRIVDLEYTQMARTDLPAKWAIPLRMYIRENFSEDREELRATDFNHHLPIRFHDGSTLLFRYAFYILDRDANEFAVFTEHCGYHIFPLLDAELELLRSDWTDVG